MLGEGSTIEPYLCPAFHLEGTEESSRDPEQISGVFYLMELTQTRGVVGRECSVEAEDWKPRLEATSRNGHRTQSPE